MAAGKAKLQNKLLEIHNKLGSVFLRPQALNVVLCRNHHLSLKLLVLLDNGENCKGGQTHGHDTNHGSHPLYTSPGSELVNLLTLGGPGLKPLHPCSSSGVPEPLLSHTVLAEAVLGGVLMHMLLPILQVVLSCTSTLTKTEGLTRPLSHCRHTGFHGGSLDLL